MTTLAVDVADVLATGQTATNPASSGHLGDEVLGILDGSGQGRHQGGELLREEGLRYSVARLTHAAHFRVEQRSLHVRVATATAHEGHAQEGAGLLAGRATLAQESRLVAQDAVGVDVLVVIAIAIARIHDEAFHGQRIHLARIRHQVSGGIVSRTNGLLVILIHCA